MEKNTLVIFTSDNGPWAVLRQHGGSAGPLYGAKTTSYEGGMRVPAIFWWPGTIDPAVITDLGSTLDLLPTFASLAGVPLPEDRTYDGYDLSSVLEGGEESPRKEMIYYHGLRVFAARKGNFKLYFYKNNPLGYPEKLEELDTLELYNLQYDPSEQFDIAENHPGIAEEIEEMVRNHKSTVEPAENQMEKTIKEQNL